jgi:ABC-2 type transport system permease protein
MNRQARLAMRTRARGGRVAQICAAFLWMGYVEALAFPLGFTIGFFVPIVQPIVFSFIAQLVNSTPAVGNDYYTFATIGLIVTATMGSALRVFSIELDVAVDQGRFETLLTEPIRWRILPFAIAGWPMLEAMVAAITMSLTALLLGADVELTGVPLAIVVLLLGIAASHAVGLVAASVKLLSRRADPVTTIYLLAATLFSGNVYPLELLPEPLRLISYLLPQTYVIGAIRSALMPDNASLSGPTGLDAIIPLVVFVVVIYGFGLWLYGRSLNLARKMGLLASY